MASNSINLWTDLKSFAVNHYVLSSLTLGMAPVVYSVCKWAGRIVSWLIGLEGTAKKTDELARKTLQVVQAKAFNNEKTLAYEAPEKIKEQKGIFLTKHVERGFKLPHFCGIAALPNKDGTYCLHVCPGGGNRSFSKEEVNTLMDEALQTIVQQNLSITTYATMIGRHPKNTLSFFTEWQAAHKA
jgi:hypothetical protein